MANEFDFASLGNLFGGGGVPTGLDALLSEDQRKLLGRNAALSAAGALLQASGRSAVPISMGQALGSALQAGQQGYEKARASSFQDLLLNQKLQEAANAQKLQTQVAGILTKPPTALSPEMQALAVPGMQAGPTVARAELAASIPQPSAGEVKAGQYQQIADIYAAQGKSEDAKRYQEMAEKLNPRAEVVGQPFEVTDPKGGPLLVQQYKDGTIKTMQGYGPKRDVVLQNLGGQTVAIDKSRLTGKETFAQTMTPSEIANLKVAQGNLAVAQGGLGLRQQEFNRGGYQIKETPEGFAYVPTAPGAAAMPIMGAGGQQVKGVSGAPTEAQSTAAGFAQRMELSNSIINNLPAGVQPGWGTRAAEAVPFIGGAMARSGQSVETQKYDQAAQDWIRAKLRKESGAAIGKDEMVQEYNTYFPQVGDSPEKLAQKAEARRVATIGMQKAAGKAYEPYTPLAPAPTAAPAAQPMMSGVPTWDPVKKQYVYQ
jgi:tetratricopeptide (TPR) repeat protein